MFKAYADVGLTSSLSLDVDVIAVSGSFARGNENNRHEPDGAYYLGDGSTPAYAVVNLGATYALASWLQIVGQITNLFDAQLRHGLTARPVRFHQYRRVHRAPLSSRQRRVPPPARHVQCARRSHSRLDWHAARVLTPGGGQPRQFFSLCAWCFPYNGRPVIAIELHPKPEFDSLTRVERAPAPLGPRDVRVRVHAVSLNYRDLTIARSAHRRPNAAPVVAASDGAGEVVEVGSGVSRFRVGDRVCAIFFPAWLDGELVAEYHARALGGSADGMLAEEVVAHEDALVHVPAHLSFEEASTLPCAGVTAYNALFDSAHVGPGQTVLAQGTGGVSIFTLQLAKAAGARVIVTSQSEAKRARAQQLGADHVIDYKATPNWGQATQEWTGRRGVDVVVEVGGPGTFDQSVIALRYGGTMSLLGVLTGTKGDVNTYTVFQKALHVRGIYVGSRRMFEDLNRALSANALHPIVDRVFPFDGVREASRIPGERRPLRESRDQGRVNGVRNRRSEPSPAAPPSCRSAERPAADRQSSSS